MNGKPQTEQARISVIITAYNSDRFVGQAIESVLSQTHPIHELIVVDDGSTDGTEEIVRSYSSVVYVQKSNGGTSSANNLGLKKANGNYLAFLDSDDLWPPDKLALQLEFLLKHPEVDGVFGNHQRFYNAPKEDWTDEQVADSQRILPARFKAAMLIRKESFFKVGLFDEAIRMGDFLDWYRRAMDMGLSFGMLDKVLLHRRIHNANTSLIHRSEIGDYVRLLKASMDRRRKIGND